MIARSGKKRITRMTSLTLLLSVLFFLSSPHSVLAEETQRELLTEEICGRSWYTSENSPESLLARAKEEDKLVLLVLCDMVEKPRFCGKWWFEIFDSLAIDNLYNRVIPLFVPDRNTAFDICTRECRDTWNWPIWYCLISPEGEFLSGDRYFPNICLVDRFDYIETQYQLEDLIKTRKYAQSLLPILFRMIKREYRDCEISTHDGYQILNKMNRFISLVPEEDENLMNDALKHFVWCYGYYAGMAQEVDMEEYVKTSRLNMERAFDQCVLQYPHNYMNFYYHEENYERVVEIYRMLSFHHFNTLSPSDIIELFPLLIRACFRLEKPEWAISILDSIHESLHKKELSDEILTSLELTYSNGLKEVVEYYSSHSREKFLSSAERFTIHLSESMKNDRMKYYSKIRLINNLLEIAIQNNLWEEKALSESESILAMEPQNGKREWFDYRFSDLVLNRVKLLYQVYGPKEALQFIRNYVSVTKSANLNYSGRGELFEQIIDFSIINQFVDETILELAKRNVTNSSDNHNGLIQLADIQIQLQRYEEGSETIQSGRRQVAENDYLSESERERLNVTFDSLEEECR